MFKQQGQLVLSASIIAIALQALPAAAQTAIPVTLGGGPLTNLDDFFLSADGTTLLLNGEFDLDNGGFPGDILLTVPVTGGEATILTGPSPAGDADNIGISPAGVVVFAGDGDTTGGLNLNPNENTYWTIPLSGSFPGTQPSALTTSTTTPLEVFSPRFSPDGSVFYFSQEITQGDPDADPPTASEAAIVSIPIGGGPITQVTPSAGSPNEIAAVGGFNSFDISSDGATIFFNGDSAGIGLRQNLFTIPSGGGTPTEIPLSTLEPFADIAELRLSPDGQTLVFTGDLITDSVFELFAVPVTGGDPKRISTEPVSGGDVQSFQISPDSSSVIYVSDEQINGLDELFIVSINGGPNQQINPEPVDGGDVVDNFESGAAFTPDGSQIIYIGDVITDGNREIFIVDTPDLTQAGDFNGDGVVDAADYTVWRDNLGNPDESSINNSGDGLAGVDAQDYLVWRSNYGVGLSDIANVSTPIPEPAMAAYLCSLLIGACLRCRCRHERNATPI